LYEPATETYSIEFEPSPYVTYYYYEPSTHGYESYEPTPITDNFSIHPNGVATYFEQPYENDSIHPNGAATYFEEPIENDSIHPNGVATYIEEPYENDSIHPNGVATYIEEP
jgi:hypothetical protein